LPDAAPDLCVDCFPVKTSSTLAVREARRLH
jgi:hypothetical protein